jgi:cytochrome P450
MKTFFFAGNDTTASVMSWVYSYLSKTPHVLAALRAELASVFGANSTPSEIADQILQNPKILGQLDYTLAVIKETLRLEPPAQPIRMTPSEYPIKLRNGQEYVLEKGQPILIGSYTMARQKWIWGDDAAEFRPERFMKKEIPLAFVPFSKRPRDCIGSNLAYMEVSFSCPGIPPHRPFWHPRPIDE